MTDPQMPPPATSQPASMQAPVSTAPPAATAPGPTTPAPSAATPLPGSALIRSMSRAELFIAGGALIIVLSDLIFAIFGDYGFSNVIWGAAAVSLILVLLNGRMRGMSLSASTYQLLIFLAAAVAVLAGIRNLILDVVYIPGRALDVTYYLGALTLYVGLGLMAFGAWQLWSRRTA